MTTTMLWLSVVGLALIPIIRARFGFFESTISAKSLVGLLELAFVIAVVLRTRGVGSGNHRFGPATCIGLALLVWTTAATLLSGHFAASLVRHVEWITHVMLAFAVISLVRTDPTWRVNIASVIVAGFGLYFVEFSLYRAMMPWTPETVFPVPGYSNVRHLGYHAMLVIPLSMYLLTTSTTQRWCRWALAPAMLTVAWCMLFWAGGRGPVLALAAGLTILPLFSGWKWVDRRLLWVPGSALVGLALSFVYALPGFGIGRIADRLQASTVSELSSGRVAMWEHVVGVIRQHPWFGLGPDSYLHLPHPEIPWTVQPHSFPLQAAMDWGIPGALLALTLIALLLLRGGCFLRATPQDERPSGAMLLWAVIAVLALACIDGTLYHAQPSMLLAVICGLFVAQLRPDARDARAGHRPLLPVIVSIICAAVLSAHLLSVAQAIRPGDITVARVFPSGLTDHRAPAAFRQRLVICIREDAPSCALDLALAEAHSRPPHDASFRVTRQLLEQGRIEDAIYQLTLHLPWLRDSSAPDTDDR